MSDVKMSGVEVVDYPAWTLKDFLPSEMAIINRSELPDPLTLEIVDRRNWREVVTVYGDGRDAKLILKALTSYDSNQELIAKLQAELASCANTIDSLVKSGHISHHPQVELDAMTDGMRALAATKE